MVSVLSRDTWARWHSAKMPNGRGKFAELPLVSRTKEAIDYVKKHGGDPVAHIAQTMVDDAPAGEFDEVAILKGLFGDRTGDLRGGHGQAVHDVLKNIADDLGIVVKYKRNDDMAAKYKRVLSDVLRVFQSKLADVIIPIYGMKGMWMRSSINTSLTAWISSISFAEKV